jgi:hypothetical protein
MQSFCAIEGLKQIKKQTKFLPNAVFETTKTIRARIFINNWRLKEKKWTKNLTLNF